MLFNSAYGKYATTSWRKKLVFHNSLIVDEIVYHVRTNKRETTQRNVKRIVCVIVCIHGLPALGRPNSFRNRRAELTFVFGGCILCPFDRRWKVSHQYRDPSHSKSVRNRSPNGHCSPPRQISLELGVKTVSFPSDDCVCVFVCCVLCCVCLVCHVCHRMPCIYVTGPFSMLRIQTGTAPHLHADTLGPILRVKTRYKWSKGELWGNKIGNDRMGGARATRRGRAMCV